MAAELRAIEVEGTVDEAGALVLDEPLRTVRAGRVRLIVLAPGVGNDDSDERAWLAAAATSPSLAFLEDSAEDLYTSADGRPFVDHSDAR
jgi:hypothetical protein